MRQLWGRLVMKKWSGRYPVRPGDRLSGQVEIKESRVSVSKPDLGFVRYTSTIKESKG